jgi:hypothetical protein
LVTLGVISAKIELEIIRDEKNRSINCFIFITFFCFVLFLNSNPPKCEDK